MQKYLSQIKRSIKIKNKRSCVSFKKLPATEPEKTEIPLKNVKEWHLSEE